MNYKKIYTAGLALSCVLGAAARFLFLTLGLDHQGLPINNHPTALLLVGLSVLCCLGLVLLALRCPCREKTYGLWTGSGGAIPALVGGGLVLLGALGELLFAGQVTTGALVLSFLGVVSGLCLILTHRLRGSGNRKSPPAELLPVIYLIVKLILNFKAWSVDPVILDYYPLLFGLIFALLSLYGAVGFLFDGGAPKKTLCYAALCVFFSAMAVVDGLLGWNPGNVLSYLGFLVWNLPVIARLLVPGGTAEPEQEGTAGEN